MKALRELIEVLAAKDEHFTKREIVKYGVIYPTGLVAGLALGEMIARL